MRKRRRLLAALGVALASPLDAAFGQSTPAPTVKPVRVGILSTSEPARRQLFERMFVDALRELGWTEGRNVAYDRVHANDDPKRLPARAAELVKRRPDVIHVSNNDEARAALDSTNTIPIVFAAVSEPVENRLVKSLARPGGNVTGVATIGWELGGKRLQLLKQALPKIAVAGALVDPSSRDSRNELKLIERAASAAGVKVVPATMKTIDELEAALAALSRQRGEALLVTHIPLFLRERRKILDAAARLRLPVVAHRSEMADDGALISYSSILVEQYRRAAQMIDKILKGAKPADIPVEQPTRFELVVNLRTARALGIAIPQTFLAQAERVIE